MEDRKHYDKPEGERKKFAEPRMGFIEPEIEEAGDLAETTKAFLGSFTP